MSKQGSAIRISWNTQFADPDTEAARVYQVWRRSNDTAPFVLLGEVSGSVSFTFLDTNASGVRYEYEVTEKR